MTDQKSQLTESAHDGQLGFVVGGLCCQLAGKVR